MLTLRNICDEIQLLPQNVQLAPLSFAEEQLVKRDIIAKISHLTVKARA